MSTTHSESADVGTENSLVVDRSAVDQVLKLIASGAAPQGADKLFVGVRPGGCSGLRYEMDFITSVEDGYQTLVASGSDGESLTVVMDQASATLLAGATLYYRDGLESTFVFDNPNVQRSCGCGKSFS